MSKWHYLSIVALSILLGLLLWISPNSLLDEHDDKDVVSNKSIPSSYMVNTKTTQYDEQGKISHILTADKVRHFSNKDKPAKDVAFFDQPQFIFKSDNPAQEAPWHVISDNGKANQYEDEFLLIGNVILSQALDENSFTTITSEQLLIKPEMQYAETSKPVMIKNESGTTTAVGLRISLKQGTIELLSKVRSHYELR